MKKPILEVIRFDEADIIIASGMGMTMSNFGDGTPKNGKFTFFGGSGSGPVTTGAGDDEILNAFNSYFNGGWSSIVYISINGSFGEERWDTGLGEVIDIERERDPDGSGMKQYNGTYIYRDGGFHSN